MKFIDLFRKTEKSEKTGRFSDFFLHASESKKQEVFKEAARMVTRSSGKCLRGLV